MTRDRRFENAMYLFALAALVATATIAFMAIHRPGWDYREHGIYSRDRADGGTDWHIECADGTVTEYTMPGAR